MQTEQLTIQSYVGQTLRVSLLSPDTSDGSKLMILLPGRGYKIDAPLLFYSKMMGWHHGYDTLLMQYGFHIADSDMTNMGHIYSETKALIQQALDRDYSEIVIIGKSMGTPIAGQIANEIENVNKLILLTPIGGSHKLAPTIQTLAIIGTADRYYNADDVEYTDTLEWRVYDDLNHGLMKLNDLAASTQALHDIMQVCETFLLTGTTNKLS